MRVYVCAVVQSNENSIRYNASNIPTYQPSFVIRSVTQAFWITLKHPLDMSEINLVANNMYSQKHKYFAKAYFPNFGTYTHSHQFHVYRPYAICVSSTLEGGNVFFFAALIRFPPHTTLTCSARTALAGEVLFPCLHRFRTNSPSLVIWFQCTRLVLYACEMSFVFF